jgi:hypothetical protein
MPWRWLTRPNLSTRSLRLIRFAGDVPDVQECKGCSPEQCLNCAVPSLSVRCLNTKDVPLLSKQRSPTVRSFLCRNDQHRDVRHGCPPRNMFWPRTCFGCAALSKTGTPGRLTRTGACSVPGIQKMIESCGCQLELKDCWDGDALGACSLPLSLYSLTTL